MTDATHPVTQSALEAFAQEYLHGLGASIQRDSNRWSVRLPEHVDLGFVDTHEFEITFTQEDTSEEDFVCLLTPESDFTQQLLDEAAEMAPVGKLALTEKMTGEEYTYPPWLTESDVEVVQETFNPYYDRTAVSIFVRIGIETVSKYQNQFLEVVTLDLKSRNRLPGLTELLLSDFYIPEASHTGEIDKNEVRDKASISDGELSEVISAGQRGAIDEVEREIEELRQSASRAADSEFEEYQQLQEQRINDIRNDISSLTDRLQNLSKKVDSAESQQQRVEALEKRKQIKIEKEELESELAELLQQKERGYSQKKQEIYNRHTIEVNSEPVALTLVLYERGEMELELKQAGHTASMRVPYAIGGGVTDKHDCEACGETLSQDNLVKLSAEGIQCQSCL